MQLLLEKKEVKTYIVFLLSDSVGSPPSCLFSQEPQRFLRKKSYEISFLSIYFHCKTELKSSFCLTLFQNGTKLRQVLLFY